MVAMVTKAIAAAALSAILLWVASPAVGAGWLAWVALVPVAVLVLKRPGTVAARLAVPVAYALYLELLLVPALPFGLAEGQWGDAAIPVMVGDSPVVPVAALAIPVFGLLLYLVRFGAPWGAELVGPRLSTAATVVVPAAAWVALDLVRVKLDPGGAWGPLFLSQTDAPASELAALGGPWLVTLAIVACNYGLALAIVRRSFAPALVPAGAVVAALLVAPAVDGPAGDREPVTVAAVQPGYDTAEDEDEPHLLRHWEDGSFNLAARDLIADLGGLTRRAARQGAELVVWPEAVTFVDLRQRRRARARLSALARSAGVPIVAPYFDRTSRTGAAIVARPGGSVSGPRPKQRPMWFLGEEGGDAPPPRPLAAAGARVGTLLGVDVQDPSVSRRLVAADADLIASSTHDWRQLAAQHRELSSLEAVAAGVSITKADWRFGSAVYGREGEVLADAGEDRRRTVVVAEVSPAAPTTYAHIGDVVGWMAVVLAAGAWLGSASGGAATRAVARAFDGRGPRRGSRRRRPSPARPRASGGPSPPPP
jgi:apolipoprotein N-acyltransferase